MRVINRRPGVFGAALAVWAGVWGGARAAAPCEGWLPGEGRPGVTGDGSVLAVVSWDPDGAGPAPGLLVAGGTFTGAGDVVVSNIAAWDGREWFALGAGVNGTVQALAVYDGDLIASGNFTAAGGQTANRIARFDGTAWHPLGSGMTNAVRALAVYGGELYAGGIFGSAGGVPANNLARWDGAQWRAVPGGVSGGVSALAVHGGELIVGGGFSSVGGVTADSIARWNGSSWLAMEDAHDLGAPESLCSFQGDLIAGVSIRDTGTGHTEYIGRWDGDSWESMDGGTSDHVFAMAVFGGELYAGGIFTSVAGVSTPNRIARWDGSSWSPMLSGVGSPGRSVWSLAVHDGALYAGGADSEASGNPIAHVGRWDGSAWSYVGGGIDFIVYDVQTYNGDLIAGGWFSRAGEVESPGVARWDGTGKSGWHAMGSGVAGGDGYVFDLEVFGGELIATGSFTSVDGVPANGTARWDGSRWRAMGDRSLLKMLVHDGELYATGGFGTNRSVGRWDEASGSWVAVGIFPSGTGMTALAEFQGDLVAGGIGVPGSPGSVYRWDGLAWNPIGGSMGYNSVWTLAEYQGELIAGGYFDGTYGGPPEGIARFDGTSWLPLGGGVSEAEVVAVFALRVYGGDLVVGGSFGRAGGFPGVVSPNVARWNGAGWLAMGEGADDAAVSLAEHHGELIATGWFMQAGGGPAAHLARWSGTGAPWIARQPEAVSALEGETAALTVAAASGYAGLAYQWRRDGVPITDGPGGASAGGGDVSGATSAALSIGGVRASDAGAYDCVVTGPCGMATSALAALTVSGSCAADLNGDGIVDFADYLEFLNLYDALDPRADFTGDGIVDFADYLEFLNFYDGGC